jgi:hypothetical protein
MKFAKQINKDLNRLATNKHRQSMNYPHVSREIYAKAIQKQLNKKKFMTCLEYDICPYCGEDLDRKLSIKFRGDQEWDLIKCENEKCGKIDRIVQTKVRN